MCGRLLIHGAFIRMRLTSTSNFVRSDTRCFSCTSAGRRACALIRGNMNLLCVLTSVNENCAAPRLFYLYILNLQLTYYSRVRTFFLTSLPFKLSSRSPFSSSAPLWSAAWSHVLVGRGRMAPHPSEHTWRDTTRSMLARYTLGRSLEYVRLP